MSYESALQPLYIEHCNFHPMLHNFVIGLKLAGFVYLNAIRKIIPLELGLDGLLFALNVILQMVT